MKKNQSLSQIKYDDVFEKHHIWDYRTDHLTLEAKELIIPRVIRHPIDFEKNILLLEQYYSPEIIYDVLEKTTELLFDHTLITVCQRYQKPLFSRLTPS
ncbi:MAG: hypothetical protein OXE77_10525 [Flavobacteriaceae bacterium]|nr:hypothetical protein [Flavobacteriaceae bacterium]MCY4268180.1 hypothetical protein [Flavobacteriaceae bacterium]MCY4299950.1 hypothetical protein [Flavobacteriaceae bacterium]